MIRNILLSTMLSLRAHKLRVFLTMVGIIIGIASVVTIAALGEGAKQQSMELIVCVTVTTFASVVFANSILCCFTPSPSAAMVTTEAIGHTSFAFF